MKSTEYSAVRSFVNSAIYFVTSILQKALSFFLLPLYTIYLNPEDYGLVALILTFFGVIGLLITLALNGAISRYYFIYKNEERKQQEFIGTIIISVVINCIVWFLLIFYFKSYITSIFLKDISFYPCILLGLLSTVTAPVYLLYQTILQIKQNSKLYSLNSLSFFIIALTLNLVFIVGYELGAVGLLLANAIPNILFFFYALFSLIHNKHIHFIFRFDYLIEALRFSIPLIPHDLSSTISDYIAKNVLYLKANLSNVGLYNIAFQFGNILDLLLSSISNALLPYTYNALDNRGKDEDALINLTTLIFKIICFIAILLSLTSKEIVYIMTSKEEYYIAWIAIPVISFGVLFNVLYSYYVTLLFYNIKGTRYIWIASFSGNLAHIAFSVLFTNQFKFLTPAIAVVLQRAIMFSIVYYISRKLEPVQYEIKKMLLYIVFFIVLLIIGLTPELINKNKNIDLYSMTWKALILLFAGAIFLYKDRFVILDFAKNNVLDFKELLSLTRIKKDYKKY